MRTLSRIFRAAIAAAAVIPAPAAHAVYVSASGFGQALIYPYYTVQSALGNEFNTYVTIVNGDSGAKALRVRFREGRNGREVAGFNLFLAGGAMWSGAIIPTPLGARLISADPACVSPAFTASTPGAFSFVDFNPANFTGANDDGMGTGAERLREGYAEVLEMASFQVALPSCVQLRADQIPAPGAPSGYLHGTLTLINVRNGMDFTVNAEALANLATAPYYRAPTDPYPDFDAAEIGNVASFLRNDRLYRIVMPSGLAAVEASMVRASMQNEVVMEAATQSATDWVVTMPTRRFHVAGRSSPWFAAAIASDGALHLQGQYTSRSGVRLDLVESCGFLCPPSMTNVDLRTPWSATVLGWRAGAVIPSAGAATTDALGAVNGWVASLPIQPTAGSMELHFWDPFTGRMPGVQVSAVTTRLANGSVASETIRLAGLPMTGFMVRTLRNGTLTCGAATCQANYGGSFAHRFERIVAP